MFERRKKFWKQQLKRAVIIENTVSFGIAKYLMTSSGYDAEKNKPNDRDLDIMIGTVHWILGVDIGIQVLNFDDHKIDTERIQTSAHELLCGDEMLEKLVARLLFDILSLSMMLNKDPWAQEILGKHVRIAEIIDSSRPKWPELFKDVNESLFKSLFSCFINKYMPEMKNSASELFKYD